MNGAYQFKLFIYLVDEDSETSLGLIEGMKRVLKEKLKENQEKIKSMMPAGQGG